MIQKYKMVLDNWIYTIYAYCCELGLGVAKRYQGYSFHKISIIGKIQKIFRKERLEFVIGDYFTGSILLSIIVIYLV